MYGLQFPLPCDRNQAYLLPPSLMDWLPEGHLAWFVLDAVEQIDLADFYKKYRTDGVGNSAFQLSMMIALLIYVILHRRAFQQTD
jgi:transposase